MAALAAAPLGFAPRHATPHPNPGAPQLPVRLVRQPTAAEGISYAVTSYWEERFGDQTRREMLTHTFTLHAQAEAKAAGWIVTLQASPPVSAKPDLSALEQVMHRLSALYRRLVLRLTPDGRAVALLNHAELLATWQTLRQELVEHSGGTDEVTRLLLTDLEALLQQPGPLLASLRYNYLYDALFANCYEQHLESGVRYEQPRRFAHFFSGTDLWVSERLTVARPTAPGRVALHCDGGLDEARTNRAPLAQGIDAAWAAAGTTPRAATDPATIRVAYETAYDFDGATGWPRAVELSVRCRAGLDYHKEYFLTLTHVL